MKELVAAGLVCAAALTFAIIEAANVRPVPPPVLSPTCDHRPIKGLLPPTHDHTMGCHGPQGPGRVS